MAEPENALGRARRLRGLTRAEVARAMRVSDSRIGGIEHTDIGRLSIRVMGLYAHALGGQLHIVLGEVYLLFATGGLGGQVVILDTSNSVREQPRYGDRRGERAHDSAVQEHR